MPRKAEQRRKRIPFGVPRMNLNLDEETVAKLEKDNKVARWFNDEKDRIKRALDGGWEFVNMDVKVGDVEEEIDGRIKKNVGHGIYAYLMALEKDLYEEDQAIKEEHNRMVDDAIRGGNPRGLQHHGVDPNKGSTNIKRVDYSP